uniref:Uncharacterized protein n=1 Tax=Arundo donax TaxID=35708 RepID=A0A0A8Y1L5_ARUDO
MTGSESFISSNCLSSVLPSYPCSNLFRRSFVKKERLSVKKTPSHPTRTATQ